MKEKQTLAHKKPQSTTAVQLCGQLAAWEDKEGGDSVEWGSTSKEGGDRVGWGSTLGGTWEQLYFQRHRNASKLSNLTLHFVLIN